MLGLWWMGGFHSAMSPLHPPAPAKVWQTLNPPRPIAINSISSPWAFVISVNVCVLVQKCDRVMIPCVMNVKPWGSLLWRVSSSTASCGHFQCVLQMKHRPWTMNQPRLPPQSFRVVRSHLSIPTPLIVKHHPNQVSRTSIVKHHPSNLLMYTASIIVATVDQEMVTWYAAVCVFVGTTNNV